MMDSEDYQMLVANNHYKKLAFQLEQQNKELTEEVDQLTKSVEMFELVINDPEASSSDQGKELIRQNSKLLRDKKLVEQKNENMFKELKQTTEERDELKKKYVKLDQEFSQLKTKIDYEEGFQEAKEKCLQEQENLKKLKEIAVKTLQLVKKIDIKKTEVRVEHDELVDVFNNQIVLLEKTREETKECEEALKILRRKVK